MSPRGTLALALSALVVTGCSGATTTTAPGAGTSPAAATPAVGTSASGTPSSSATPSGAARTTGAPRRAVTPPPIPSGASPVADTDPLALSVVRVQAETCQGMRQAAGTFVAPHLVLTTDHVADRASAIAVHQGSSAVRGRVVARDSAHGLAVVEVLPTGSGDRLTGPVVALGTPAAGQPVTQVGHPLGAHVHRAPGTIASLDRQATSDGQQVTGTVTHTANAAPGQSGGALLDQQGRLVGLELATTADGAGEHHAASAAAAADLLRRATASPKPVPFATCPVEGASVTSIHPDAAAVRGALARYTIGLMDPAATTANGTTGLVDAWDTLGPELQRAHGTPEKFLASFKGARAQVANVDNLEVTGWFTDTLLWSMEMVDPAGRCTVRKQKVTLSSATGTWRIATQEFLEAPRPCGQG